MKPALQPSPPSIEGFGDPQREVRRLIARHLFAMASGVALLSAALFVFLPAGLPDSGRWPLVLACAGLAALSAASMHDRQRRTEDLVAVVLIGAIAAIALAAAVLDWGIGSPGIGFLGLLVCLACAVAGWSWGLVAAGLSAATVVGLALAQQVHWLAGSDPALAGDGLWLRATIQMLLIGAGMAGGLLISRVVTRYVDTAEERELRFRGLLAIAADAYWEIDDQYRLVTFERQGAGDRSMGAVDGVGRVPWELPEFGIDDDTLDLLRAHLEAREPFRDLPVTWRGVPTRVRHYLVSGEPRSGPDAVFRGYWGVARDVSADVQARVALEATESRYQDLFTRIPTPLVLHAGARVLDANPAALAMFGYSEVDAMLGEDLLAAFEGGDSRERARRRLETLDGLPPGEALPVAEFRILTLQGRRHVVRATGVRVDAPDGAAVLSIFVDDTERKKAEDAVRRSEAMLSHLVATSPDAIMLTDLATGRYAMVNRTFERQTGYAAAEVVGRSAVELGLWRDPQVRDRFIASIREQGVVQDLPAEFVARSGALLSMRVSGARFAMDRRDYLVVNARDVTEAERARREREAILQNASVGIAVTRDRVFVLANPRFEQMYGWPEGALIGQSGRVVWDSDEEFRHIGATLGPILERGDTAEIETRARRFDGSTFIARVTGKAIDPTHPAEGGTIWIVEDVTERRQVEQALARARDAAEAASRAKSAFLANTSHELRTPLNGVLGLARLAAAPETDEERRRQYLAQIGDTAQALSGIISDILDLSKIEAGKLDLENVVFDLSELLRGFHRAYAVLAEPRGIAMRLQLGAGLDLPVRGDPLRTRQILGNYLSNALKFTEAGEVRLAAWRLDERRVRFEVHDTGPGIEPAAQARLFEPFVQADQSTTRRFGGTGLGLSICRELARLMGGEVGVASRPGEGSCFWAELPLPVAATAGEAAERDTAAAPDELAGARILMVEDNAVNMLIAVAMLEQWGLQVEQVGDGAQAVVAVQRAAESARPFDLVLMDVMMPVMSGYEATRLLRQRFDAQALPIIALTAAALVTEREQALAAGMNDFLTKPIDAARLRQTLQRWIRRPAGPEEQQAPHDVAHEGPAGPGSGPAGPQAA